jgi:hypothetical protein
LKTNKRVMRNEVMRLKEKLEKNGDTFFHYSPQ